MVAIRGADRSSQKRIRKYQAATRRKGKSLSGLSYLSEPGLRQGNEKSSSQLPGAIRPSRQRKWQNMQWSLKIYSHFQSPFGRRGGIFPFLLVQPLLVGSRGWGGALRSQHRESVCTSPGLRAPVLTVCGGSSPARGMSAPEPHRLTASGQLC